MSRLALPVNVLSKALLVTGVPHEINEQFLPESLDGIVVLKKSLRSKLYYFIIFFEVWSACLNDELILPRSGKS